MKVPRVDWNAQDLMDTVSFVTERTIRQDWKVPESASVYTALVPISDLEARINAEEESPWEDFIVGRRAFPPIMVIVRSNGYTHIADGNHRVHYWERQGYTHAPAWVIDKRLRRRLR